MTGAARLRRRGLIAVAVAISLAVAGCGGGGHSGRKSSTGSGSGSYVDIYSDLPLHGPDAARAAAVNDGIELSLALAGHRAGTFAVRYTELDNATATSDGWDPTKTVSNARMVATDSHAIFDIGDVNSEANELSIPILNEAGIAQVSPSATYVGLTEDELGSAPGEPIKYYPTGDQTFFRLVPRDPWEAGADLEAMRQSRCTHVAVASEATPFGKALTTLMSQWGQSYGIDSVSARTVEPTVAAIDQYAAMLRRHPVDCFEFAGLPQGGGVAITEAVHQALPGATLFGPSPMCTGAWTNAADGGVPASIDRSLRCTEPTLGLTGYIDNAACAQCSKDAANLVAAYQQAHDGANPGAYALFGYEAMQLGLDTIDKLGAKGDDRAAVVAALQAIRHRVSVLGTFSFDPLTGDSSLRDYGLYVVRHGEPVYEKTVDAKDLLIPAVYP